MPELPEVETVCRGLAPHLLGRRICNSAIVQPSLRWPVAVAAVQAASHDSTIVAVRRRAKYLLLDLQPPQQASMQTMAIHLGMSGWLGVRPKGAATKLHDHAFFTLDNGHVLCFNDPRRFGSIHVFATAEQAQHRLLAHLGVEPLQPELFTAAYLYAACRKRVQPIKQRLMDASMVVGVGNIYAAEALFAAGISPLLPCKKLSAARAAKLVVCVREVLQDAIDKGGTTLRDFLSADGIAGMFAPRLRVYGREGLPCHACAAPVLRVEQGGRSTFYCRVCQKR